MDPRIHRPGAIPWRNEVRLSCVLATAASDDPALPAGMGFLSAVACVSATDCVAVGNLIAEFYHNLGTHLAEQWNGRTWAAAGSPGRRLAVACPVVPGGGWRERRTVERPRLDHARHAPNRQHERGAD